MLLANLLTSSVLPGLLLLALIVGALFTAIMVVFSSLNERAIQRHNQTLTPNTLADYELARAQEIAWMFLHCKTVDDLNCVRNKVEALWGKFWFADICDLTGKEMSADFRNVFEPLSRLKLAALKSQSGKVPRDDIPYVMAQMLHDDGQFTRVIAEF